MLRNVLRTDRVKEASELFNVGMLPYLLVFAVLPLLLLFRIGLRREPMRRALPIRLVALVAVLFWWWIDHLALSRSGAADAQQQGNTLSDHSGQLSLLSGQCADDRCQQCSG